MAGGSRGYVIVPRRRCSPRGWLLVTHVFSDMWPFLQFLPGSLAIFGAIPQ